MSPTVVGGKKNYFSELINCMIQNYWVLWQSTEIRTNKALPGKLHGLSCFALGIKMETRN